MGEKIEFPRNYRTYIQRAEEAVSNGQISEAQRFLEKAYEIKKEPHINAFYVSVLIEGEKYSEALEIAEDFEDMYRQDMQHNSLFIFLLIKNHRFIQAEELLDQLKKTEGIQENEVNQMEQLIQEESEIKKKQDQQELKELTRKLFALSDLSIEEQLSVVDQAQALTESNLIAAVPFVIEHPFVSQLVKSLYLQTMIKREVDFDFRYSCFDLEKTVNPVALHSVDQDPVVIEVNRQLEQQLEKNPSLLELIRPELNLHIMSAYPFTQQIIKNPDKWVEVYTKFYSEGFNKINSFNLPPEEQEITNWILKLSGLNG